jgi:hypothetical protein
MLLLKLRKEQKKCLCILVWTTFKALFEKISSALKFRATVTFEKLGEIRIPNIKDVGPPKESNSTLISFESFLKVVVFFQKDGIVHDDLRSGNFQFNDAVIDSFAGFESSETFFQVSVKTPNLNKKKVLATF